MRLIFCKCLHIVPSPADREFSVRTRMIERLTMKRKMNSRARKILRRQTQQEAAYYDRLRADVVTGQNRLKDAPKSVDSDAFPGNGRGDHQAAT